MKSHWWLDDAKGETDFPSPLFFFLSFPLFQKIRKVLARWWWSATVRTHSYYPDYHRKPARF